MNPDDLLEIETATLDDAQDENAVLCLLTDLPIKPSPKEDNLQSLIRMLMEEYGFDRGDMARDYTITSETDEGKKWKRRLELVVFRPDRADYDHPTQADIIRLCVVQDPKVKSNDQKKGPAALQEALGAVGECEFGLWFNGAEFTFLRKKTNAIGQAVFEELSDFPGAGETLDDLDRSDKLTARVPANDSLVRTFKYCHDYIYGNEGRTKDAFWQLLNLIFCKIYDEKRRDICARTNTSYRRRFWVGVTEKNTTEGQMRAYERINELFQEMKGSAEFDEVFEGNEEIKLTPRGLAFVAAELARYSFLDATVDVKGLAYETIVGNTLKRERGQFFTPRNIMRAMVQMMDPDPHERVLDPSCGSGGFLVMTLDHVRHKLAQRLFPELEGEWLRDKYNSPEVNAQVQEYAETYQFGIDFDPDLKRAARMNMVMAGDGHANIFHFNSLEYPGGHFPDRAAFDAAVQRSIEKAQDQDDLDTEHGNQGYSNSLGCFDLIFSNPPFGAKIPINDRQILEQFDLGHTWRRLPDGAGWDKQQLQSSQPPEILFIDRCYQFLKPGAAWPSCCPMASWATPTPSTCATGFCNASGCWRPSICRWRRFCPR
ncbi:HsdM family class I SAM-dependent methyltransferase [Hymenobacter gummosus]|uniref:HsdM family class I SAM-dependent methyltransferase n=1 Tax=Hymenobacter gummosus TaxID=1776032 RepID=UPI001A9DD069|nr:N-6 DNA methylase [Hymenobacter gummosus]